MRKVIQFGYNVKVPEGIPLVDCRVIPNPYPKYAHDPVAARYSVRTHEKFLTLVQTGIDLLKEHDVVGVGCGYGVHRSGTVVKEMEKLTWMGDCPEFEVENWGKA